MQNSNDLLWVMIGLGSICFVVYFLWAWFEVTDRIALWIIRKIQVNIRSYFKGLF